MDFVTALVEFSDVLKCSTPSEINASNIAIYLWGSPNAYKRAVGFVV